MKLLNLVQIYKMSQARSFVYLGLTSLYIQQMNVHDYLSRSFNLNKNDFERGEDSL